MHSGLFYQKYRKLLSKIPFTLHQIACNPDKHWGCERWRVKLTLHHPSPTLHLISVPVTIEACSWASMMAKPFSIKRCSLKTMWGWRVVKGGEGLKPPFTSRIPSVYRGCKRKGEGWRVKKKVAFLRAERPMITGREGWSNRNDSPGESFLPTYRFLPGNGTKLPWQGAISCHNQAIRGIRLRKITE